MDSQFVPTPLQPLQERDLLKQQLAKEKDLTLISVPFWWDGKEERYLSPFHFIGVEVGCCGLRY